ncbi:MAG: AMP-binding protein, partial [Ktedonobacteraceae bacterium]
MNKFFSNAPLESSTLVELLCRRALQHPERRAFTFLVDGELEGDCLTYQDLDRRARAIGALLQQYVVPGQRALLVYPPGIEFITAFFGCLYSGIIAVPTYPPQTRTRRSLTKLRAIVNDVQPVVALTSSSISTTVENLFAQVPELQTTRLVATDHVPDNLAEIWQDPGVGSDTLAFFQYTSGSTGMPKGVMLTHGNLVHNLALIHRSFKSDSNTHGIIWLPLYHDMGLIGGILGACYCGGQSTVMPPAAFLQRPIRWLQAISNTRATTSGGPDFAYDLCVRKITAEQKAGLDLSSWDIAFNGAEPIRQETLERFTEAFAPCGFRREALYSCYGLAEGTLLVSSSQKATIPVVRIFQSAPLEQNQVVMAEAESVGENGGTRTLVSCGQPVSGQKVVIVNPESLSLCLPDQVGEVWVAGPSIAQGYWQKPEETERTFRGYLADTGEGPFLHTGDLGFLQDGELFITGRLKDLIIIRGRNHYPQDIELTVEQSHPALRPGCGVAFSVDVLNEERLVIVQEVERQYRKLNVGEVVETIRHAVAEEHELQVYAVVLIKTGSIPKTSSGKRQRRACREGFLARNLNVVGEWILEDSKLQTSAEESDVDEPAGWQKSSQSIEGKTSQVIQTWLIDQISEQLKIPPQSIDIREPLVHYGMDSLQAVSLAADLEDWLGQSLPPTLAYDYPTIEALAQYLAGEPLLESPPGNGTEWGGFAGRSLETEREQAQESEDNEQIYSKKTNQEAVSFLCNTRIESLGTYLPARDVSTEDVLRACKQQVLFPLQDFTGIKSRRVVGEGEFSIDLAKKAIEDCLDNSRYHPADIDILICCNCSRCDGPNYQITFEPGTSIKLKKYFGFDNALVFDITNACAGMFTGVYIVDALIKAGLIRCGMVASGEYITHLTHTAQKEIDNYMDLRLACLTLGDAGAAIILDRSPGDKLGFHEIDMYTLGRYSPYCIAGPTEEEHGGAIMFTEMGKLAAVGIKQSVAHVFHVLKQLQRPVDAFQHIIPHQTSKISLDEVARETNRLHNREVCSDRNIIYNLTERGNTASTSHFVALKDNIVNSRIASGDNVIFSITASGLNVGTALYTFDDLPDRLRRKGLNGEELQKIPAARKKEDFPPPVQTPRVRVESVGTVPDERMVTRKTQDLVEAAVEDCL